MINNCGFIDLGFNGLEFTWCNKRDPQARVWERLDRALANAAWISLHENYRVQHLPMVGSDHRPILLDTVPTTRVRRNFHFEAMWNRHESFLHQVMQSWSMPMNGSPLDTLSNKIQNCKQDPQNLEQDCLWPHWDGIGKNLHTYCIPPSHTSNGSQRRTAPRSPSEIWRASTSSGNNVALEIKNELAKGWWSQRSFFSCSHDRSASTEQRHRNGEWSSDMSEIKRDIVGFYQTLFYIFKSGVNKYLLFNSAESYSNNGRIFQ